MLQDDELGQRYKEASRLPIRLCSMALIITQTCFCLFVFKTFYLFLLLLFYVYLCFPCMDVCTPHVCSVRGSEIRSQIFLQELELQIIMNPWSSGRLASALSQHPQTSFVTKNYKKKKNHLINLVKIR